MRSASHENVVKLLGFEKAVGMDENLLIMEYCSGGNLDEAIKDNPNGLPSNECLQVFQNLTAALKHLHEKKIVHRDIKPANILQTESNNKKIYKLGDFGAARILEKNETYDSLYGTHEYIHPDIFAKYYRPMLDNVWQPQYFKENHELWSVGVTFYEIATGHLPFKPKKGRADPKKMFEMIADKKSGDLSATEMEGGRIAWSRKLPNCNLKGIKKKKLMTLLAGLLEATEENMWSHEQFFKKMSSICGSAKKHKCKTCLQRTKKLTIRQKMSRKGKKLCLIFLYAVFHSPGERLRISFNKTSDSKKNHNLLLSNYLFKV